MPLHARLLPPISRTGRLGWTGSLGTGRFLALGPVEALVQVAHLSFKHFDLCLQGRFALHQAHVLCPPVVGLPLEPDIVLLRQHYYLLGKGRGALAVDRCTLRGGDGLWLSTFHELCFTRFFWKEPFFLREDGNDGVPEDLLSKRKIRSDPCRTGVPAPLGGCTSLHRPE